MAACFPQARRKPGVRPCGLHSRHDSVTSPVGVGVCALDVRTVRMVCVCVCMPSVVQCFVFNSGGLPVDLANIESFFSGFFILGKASKFSGSEYVHQLLRSTQLFNPAICDVLLVLRMNPVPFCRPFTSHAWSHGIGQVSILGNAWLGMLVPEKYTFGSRSISRFAFQRRRRGFALRYAVTAYMVCSICQRNVNKNFCSAALHAFQKCYGKAINRMNKLATSRNRGIARGRKRGPRA